MMNLKRNNFLSRSVVLILMLVSMGSYAQISSSSTPKERLYLHFNKDLYMPGEVAWFTLYSYDLTTQKPFHGEKRVAFIDLISKQGQKVLDTRLALNQEGHANGSFFIPDGVTSGDYWVLAYTDPESASEVFKKQVRIINPMEESFRSVLTADSTSFVLYPEGGNFVLEKPNRMAFYLNGLDIEQLPYTLFVTAEDESEIFEFPSNVSGSGLFSFTPRRNKTYNAYLRFRDGSFRDVKFPTAISGLPGLMVEQLDNNAGEDVGNVYKVTTYWDGRLQGDLILRLQQFGQLLEERELNTIGNSDSHIFTLPADLNGSFWFEIVHNGKPVASRLIFLGSPVSQDLAITFPRSMNMVSREQGQFTIQTSTLGAPATLSISVYRKPDGPDLLQQFHTMEVDRWLSANGVSDDLGALSEQLWFGGNRRFDTSNPILIAQKPEDMEMPEIHRKHAPYQTISFSIRHKQNSRPIVGEYFYLSFPGLKERLYLSKTDADGIAAFYVDPVFGRNTAVLTAVNGQEFDMKLLDQHFADFAFLNKRSGNVVEGAIDSGNTDGLPSIPVQWEEWLEDYSIGVQAENVYFRRERAEFDSTKSLYRAPLYGHADRVYRLDDYTRFVLMKEVLQEYMPEVMVIRRNNSHQFRVHDQRTNLFFDENPLVLVDGVPVQDLDRIIDYDPRNVEEIAIIRAKFYYGPLEYQGLVSFKTYAGDLKNFELEDHSVLFDYDGFHLERKFYSPDYNQPTKSELVSDDPSGLSLRIPDLRNVLYWNGSVETDGKENLTINVATSDFKGEYIIEIEGMDSMGRMLKGRSSLHVR